MDNSVRDFDGWWDYGDPAGTASRFRARLAEPLPDEAYRLELLTQLARTEGLQRNFAAAHAILDEIESALTEALPVAWVRYHLERGRVLNSAGEGVLARPHFQAAWDGARQVGADSLAVDAAHMVAIVAEPDEQILWNEQAIAYAEASEQPGARNWLGSLYNNLGWTYHDLGQLDKALDLFERAQTHFAERAIPDRLRIARWCVARCLRSIGRLDEALAGQRALEAEYAALDEAAGYVYEELGELLLLQGDAQAAAPYFGQAHAILSQDAWLQAQEPERLARLQTLAQS